MTRSFAATTSLIASTEIHPLIAVNATATPKPAASLVPKLQLEPISTDLLVRRIREASFDRSRDGCELEDGSRLAGLAHDFRKPGLAPAGGGSDRTSRHSHVSEQRGEAERKALRLAQRDEAWRCAL